MACVLFISVPPALNTRPGLQYFSSQLVFVAWMSERECRIHGLNAGRSIETTPQSCRRLEKHLGRRKRSRCSEGESSCVLPQTPEGRFKNQDMVIDGLGTHRCFLRSQTSKLKILCLFETRFPHLLNEIMIHTHLIVSPGDQISK